MALPAFTLIAVVVAHMMRMTRAAMINALASPYIEMASLKGACRASIIFRHALPNALSPIINVVVLNLAYLVVGVVVVEVVFVYPGMGQLMVDAVAKRDLPVVHAALIFAATYILLNLGADILVIVANPRLRHRMSCAWGVGGGLARLRPHRFGPGRRSTLIALLGPLSRPTLAAVRGVGGRRWSRSRPRSRSAPTASAATCSPAAGWRLQPSAIALATTLLSFPIGGPLGLRRRGRRLGSTDQPLRRSTR